MHRQARNAFRKTARISSLGAKSLPQKYFVSPAVFAVEQAEIFSKEWLLVGHQSQVLKPGDYFLAAIAGESVIVTRDRKSQVRLAPCRVPKAEDFDGFLRLVHSIENFERAQR